MIPIIVLAVLVAVGTAAMIVLRARSMRQDRRKREDDARR
jgi:hypothetical protein